MVVSGLQQAPSSQYLAVTERTNEMALLQAQAHRRKSMLIFGPETVGKTRLLESFVKTQKFALYVNRIQVPRDLVLNLVDQLRGLHFRDVHLPADPKSFSTPSLKGTIQRALEQGPFMMVLDHLAGPSRGVTGMVNELNYYNRTPVFFAARAPHMEDVGTLLPMCLDRSERVEVKNFSPPIALEFAYREAERAMLWASNLKNALQFVAEKSEGNPGAILQMIKMARLPKYRVGGQIKAHVLYLDYRMGCHHDVSPQRR